MTGSFSDFNVFYLLKQIATTSTASTAITENILSTNIERIGTTEGMSSDTTETAFNNNKN